MSETRYATGTTRSFVPPQSIGNETKDDGPAKSHAAALPPTTCPSVCLCMMHALARTVLCRYASSASFWQEGGRERRGDGDE